MAVAFVFQLIFIGLFSLAASISSDPKLEDVIGRLIAVERKLSDSEKEIEALREDAVIQKAFIEKQGTEIRKLKRHVADQDVIIRSNRLKISDHSRETESLRSRLLQNDMVNQQMNISEEKNGRKKTFFPDGRHQSVMKDHTVNIRKSLRSFVGGGVAFTAYMDHDGDFGADQTIIFNRVITNEGSGYNKYTGVFTCPQDGMYLFSFFIWERSDTDTIKQVRGDLTVNGRNIVGSVSETWHHTEDAQGGNSAVIRLNQGDAVWIKVHYGGHIAGNTLHFNTFTGLYLYP
ncbi:caprin-2-like isoform X2 [Mercenaria mercenaria]|uniref:caprin-2-like isoform X2 n=1 Tax=Mercenaria mercenaria TaxID=6596 RepID=UPI00234F0629|nr:caprin-2-like isoform X2 [Mercenaria mercenaria]